MFEMFALLTNLLILTISDAMVTCYLFSFYLHVWSSPTQRVTHQDLLHYIFENLPWKFTARICRGYLLRGFAAGFCRGNLPQEFPVAICRENLPQEFVVEICLGYLPWIFCICKQILFCICEQKFLFVRFSLLTVFLFVIVVAVMGHRSHLLFFHSLTF